MNSSHPSSSAETSAKQWRTARRVLLATVGVATLIALFYTVENWRGKRAWEECRRDLERQGQILDWTAYVPPAVPDEQNVFKVPQMQEWFVKPPGQKPGPSAFGVNTPRNAVLLAQIKAAPRGALVDLPGTHVVRWEDPATGQKASGLLIDSIGACAFGAQNCVLVRKPLDQFEPLQMILQADRVPTAKELVQFLFRNPLTNSTLAWSTTSYLRAEPAPGNSFRLVLAEPVYDAAQYLALTEPLNEKFDLVRKALERPYARMEGNYELPYGIPIPNFVEVRNVAQILSQRAQSHLLLGQSAAAWQELSLIRDLCGILGTKLPGKPSTLVAAMIEVAVMGVYTAVIEDGLRLHAWAEPELAAIERQLKETDLLGSVVKGLHSERAGVSRTIETTSPGELAKMFRLGSNSGNWVDPLKESMWRLALGCMPRGWFYQNMAIGAGLQRDWLECVDLTNYVVLPHLTKALVQQVQERPGAASPYNFLAAAVLPNLNKAVQTAARNQTSVNQARLACALERYRLAEGQYPESLDRLVPRFIDNLPHDLIGGQPLKCRRTDTGDFLLYSVGWDEKDEGGIVGKVKEEGDWVWSGIEDRK